MCKIREYQEVVEQYKVLEARKKAMEASFMETMLATGVDKLMSEDGAKYVKIINMPETNMNYVRKAYSYVRIY